MQLNNTIILPGDNPELSERLLRSLIEKQDVVTVIIFGRDAVSEDAVQKADLRASAVVAGVIRKVAWMQDTAMLGLLKTLITAGAGGDPNTISTDIHIGIAISMTDVLMAVIPKTPTVDYIRMERAFIKASTI
jgi:hypothetical protein